MMRRTCRSTLKSQLLLGFGTSLVGLGILYGLHGTDAKWLALNLYHEDRVDGLLGRRAIAAVVFNRMHDPRWPKTVKGVVTAGIERGPNCDFSWYCDKKPDFKKIRIVAWLQNYALAYQILLEHDLGLFQDPTHGATWYHVRTMQKPKSWPDTLEAVGDVGLHTFYRYSNKHITAIKSP